MPDSRLDRLERLFRAALMHPPEERDEFLEAACPDDPELRTEVASLLRADAEAEEKEFLDQPITSLSGLGEFLDEQNPGDSDQFIGSEIGPYRILRFIGHGGMGDVYLAVREEPFRQHVALKIIRGGMNSAEVTRRFEMERQILASLNHPNIGRLYDGGVTAEGLPFFAMEYVDGNPITAFCDTRSMPLDDRLRLFQQVCRAVHHAHQNLVIHRDLKPSNILVTGEGLPKLLDFGIAKLLNPNLGPVDAPITRTEIRAMTPEYASPEQARGESLTTASDIYSLGVILYELLTGGRPYYFRKKTSEEILSILYDHEPGRPSSVVTSPRKVGVGTRTTELQPEEVGRLRGLSPDRLRRRLQGDLDNIVLMALRKEPERRYTSAAQLAGDIESYLTGSPVIAHRDSRGYRLRKYVQRHRVQAISTAIIALLLIVGSAVTIYQANQVVQQRDRAQLEAERAAHVTNFLVSLFEASDPSFAPGDTLTVREILTEGAERIGKELFGRPSIQATLYDVIGTAYLNLGHYDLAEETLRTSLELRRNLPGEREELASTLYSLGFAYEVLGNFQEAQESFSESLAIQQELGPKTRPTYLVGLLHLGTVTHFRGERETADSLYDEWEELYSQTAERDDPELAEATFGMARVSFARREFRKAEEYVTNALNLRIREKGEIHADVASSLLLLGSIQHALGKEEDAEETTLRALAMLLKIYPGGHRDIAATYELLGNVYNGQGKISDAEEQFLKAIDLWRASHYSDPLSVGLARASAGRFYLGHRRYGEAEKYFREASRASLSILGNESPVTIRMRTSLAEALIGLGRVSDARAILTSYLPHLTAERGPDDELTRRVRNLLARIE